MAGRSFRVRITMSRLIFEVERGYRKPRKAADENLRKAMNGRKIHRRALDLFISLEQMHGFV